MTYEYIIYGGFDVVVKALQSIALIFSDSSYTSLFWTFATFGLGMSVVAYYLSALFARTALGPFEWAKTYWWAIFFFFVLMSPTGTLNVYDAHKNRFQSVGNLPVGVVLAAGLLNKVEVGLTDMVNTAMSPLISYDDAGNGQGMDMIRELYSFVQKDFRFSDSYDQKTLDSFIMECYLFGVLSGDISQNDFRVDQNFMTGTFAQANYPNIYSIVYSEANRSGATTSCQDAYTYLNSKFTSAYLEQMFGDFCSKTGYSKNSPQELVRCKEVFFSHIQSLAGYAGTDPNFILLQMYIAQDINNIMIQGNPVETAQFVGAREAASGMMGVGIMANEFIPIFRSVMLAVAFAITPLLFLFIATFALEAFGYFLGLLTWLAVWGVMDVILHNFAMSYAYDILASLRTHSTAFVSIFSFDEYAARVLSVMGYMRVLGVMLSSSIVFGIIKFGGEAFAMAAGSMQGTVEGSGRTAGSASMTAEGRGSYVSNFDHGIGQSMAQANTSGFDRQSITAQHDMAAATEARNLNRRYGGPVNVGNNIGDFNSATTSSNVDSFGKQTDAVGGADNWIDQKSDAEANRGVAQILQGLGEIKHWGDGDIRSAAEKGAKIGLFDNIEKGESTLRAVKSLSDATGMPAEVSAAAIGIHGGAEQGAKLGEYFNSGAVRDFMANKYGVSSGALGNFNGFLKGSSSKEDFAEHFKNDSETMGLYDSFATDGNGNELSKEEMSKKFRDQKTAAGIELARMKGSTQGAEDIGNLQQMSNKAAAIFPETYASEGASAAISKLAQFENEGTITEESSRALNKALGVDNPAAGPVKSGMIAGKHNIGVNPETGALSLTGAEFQDSNGSVSIGGGKVTREGTLTAPEAVKKARELRANGHGAAAQGLEEIAKGLKGGEAIAFKEETGLDGKSATFHAKHGTETDWMDLSNRTSGREAVNKDIGKNISDHQDEIRSGLTLSKGTKIDSDTAFQMALKGDEDLYRMVTNPYLSEKGRDAEIAALSSSLGNADSAFMSRFGVTTDSSSGDATLSVGAGGGIIFKANMGASGNVSVSSEDRKTVDLMTQQRGALIRSVLNEAKEKGLNPEQTRKLLADRGSDYTSAFDKNVHEASPSNYGATRSGTLMMKGAKELLNGTEGSASGELSEGDVKR